MSTIQSPQILTDLYSDLRDRRLLPLVIVLAVGMAVVPIALSSSAEPVPPAPPSAAVKAKSNAPAEAVVVANPGVRDYKRRLDDAPVDPFVQKFIPAGGSDSGTPTADSTASTPTTADSVSSAGTTAATDTGGSTSAPQATVPAPQPQTESKYFYYRIKVRAGQVGTELKVYESVGSLAQLPSKNVPALAFLGVNTNGALQPKTAVFLVSSAVTAIDGEGQCTFAGTTCQMLSLKPGQHADLVWTDGLAYRVNLVKFDLIERDSPPTVGGDGGSSGRKQGSAGRSGRHFSF